jgi:tRNA pseudouridine13 synthase
MALMQAVVAEEGFELSHMKLKGMREPFFSKGDRPAVFVPAGLTYESGADEHHPGRQKLVLAFELPRGCYATMLVKRITIS